MKKKLVKGALLLSMVTIGFSPSLSAQAKTTPKLAQKRVTIKVGQKKKLKIKGTGKRVRWTSNKKKIVTVSPKGVLKGKKAGKATITAKVGKKKFKCKVTVNKGNPSLNAKSITLKKGGSYKLKVKNGTGVKWSSNNKGVATVSSKGVVKAKKTGKATITAKVGKKKLTCKVTVKKGNKSDKENGGKINISKEVKKQLPSSDEGCHVWFDSLFDTVPLNKPIDLFKYVQDTNKPIKVTSNLVKTKYYKWFSSDNSILSINKYGVATAHKEGKVKIHFKYMTKSGKWETSRVTDVKVRDLGNVSFSYQFGLDMDIVNSIPEALSGGRWKEPGAFNCVTITVTNNSNRPISAYNQLGVFYSYYKNLYLDSDITNKQVLPGETKTFRYSTREFVYLSEWIDRVIFYYNYNDNLEGVEYIIPDDCWIY